MSNNAPVATKTKTKTKGRIVGAAIDIFDLDERVEPTYITESNVREILAMLDKIIDRSITANKSTGMTITFGARKAISEKQLKEITDLLDADDKRVKNWKCIKNKKDCLAAELHPRENAKERTKKLKVKMLFVGAMVFSKGRTQQDPEEEEEYDTVLTQMLDNIPKKKKRE